VTGTRSRPSWLAGLVVSRGVDQGVLGLASLFLAARLGPVAFAPLGVLFVVNSLAIQISDFGVGFRVMRTAPDEILDRRGLQRLRIANSALAAAAVALGLLVGGDAGAVVAGSGVVWALSAEAYVRKTGALKARGPRPVIVAELVSASLFAVGAAYVGLDRKGALALAVVFVVKHLVEIALTGSGLARFAPGGAPVGSSAEWFGQVLTYLVANVDFVAVALLLGSADLSRYLVGFRLAAAIPALLAVPVTQVAFLDLSGHTGDEAQPITDGLVRRAFRLGVLGGGAALVAAVVVPALLGSEWEGTGAVTALLALAVPWRMLLGVTVAMALTAGRPEAVVRWEAIRLVAVGIAVVLAATASIEAVAAAVAAMAVVGITVEHGAAARLVGVHVRREVVVGAAVMVPVVVAAAFLLAG
jgi:hypothetical protein